MSKIQVTRRYEIDAGHRIPFHTSKCRHLHGHRYVIHLTMSAPHVLSAALEHSGSGMVVDFGILKAAMVEVLDKKYDHRMILWRDDEAVGLLELALDPALDKSAVVVDEIPTAENLAKIWFEEIAIVLGEKIIEADLGEYGDLIKLDKIVVYETPNCWAEYAPADPNA